MVRSIRTIVPSLLNVMSASVWGSRLSGGEELSLRSFGTLSAQCIFITVAGCVLAACSAPGQLIRMTPADGTIVGIKPFLSPGAEVHVVLVHGMCTHKPKWVDEANQEIADALQATVTERREPVPIGRHGGMLYERHLTADGARVRTFALLWSPIVADAKKTLCYDETERTAACETSPTVLPDKRVLINGMLKNQIMDECLSDAVFYAGETGRALIAEAIEAGLLTALSGGGPVPAVTEGAPRAVGEQTAPLFLVTSSLGSKMTFDGLIRMANKDCETYMRIAAAVSRTRQVFMQANQLPILSLAYDPLLAPPYCPPPIGAQGILPLQKASLRGISAIAALHRQGRQLRALGSEALLASGEELRIAAFSDPNDILSYTLVPWVTGDDYTAVDVVMTDATPLFGLFEDPVEAHTSYGTRSLVKGLIACGNPRAGNARVATSRSGC